MAMRLKVVIKLGTIVSVVLFFLTVTGAVSNNNVYGTQFHPEKSGEIGLKILKAFCEIGGIEE